jgi:hypothetical protein
MVYCVCRNPLTKSIGLVPVGVLATGWLDLMLLQPSFGGLACIEGGGFSAMQRPRYLQAHSYLPGLKGEASVFL